MLGYVAPIVEGHGEVEALPILLQRIARMAAPERTLRVNPPVRVRASSFMNDDAYLARYVRLAAAKAAPADGLVLILLDCDDDCPAELGPRLLRSARAVRDDVRYLVALAHREYESWFLAAARSLRGAYGLPDDLEPPANSTTTRGAKGWLGRHMPEAYDPITHQAEFSRLFDLDEARANPSFARFFARLTSALSAEFGSAPR